jgi:hypothetical protein
MGNTNFAKRNSGTGNRSSLEQGQDISTKLNHLGQAFSLKAKGVGRMPKSFPRQSQRNSNKYFPEWRHYCSKQSGESQKRQM